MTPTVTVVIPARDAEQSLGATLAALAQQTTDAEYEVIVVDDGSTDDTPQVLGANAGRITVVQGGHGGLSAARNLGLARATGEGVAIHRLPLALRHRARFVTVVVRERERRADGDQERSNPHHDPSFHGPSLCGSDDID